MVKTTTHTKGVKKMKEKMIKRNGETKRDATLMGAKNYIQEAHEWVQNIVKELNVGESVKVEVSVKCCDGWYECSDSWETEFIEE